VVPLCTGMEATAGETARHSMLRAGRMRSDNLLFSLANVAASATASCARWAARMALCLVIFGFCRLFLLLSFFMSPFSLLTTFGTVACLPPSYGTLFLLSHHGMPASSTVQHQCLWEGGFSAALLLAKIVFSRINRHGRRHGGSSG